METRPAIQATTEDRPMSFVPYGSADAIKLSVAIIQNIVAVPTRSGKTCSKRDAVKFMMMCQARRLNPFEGDAFLVGYDGKTGPEFSLITAHQAFLKRAEIHPEFDGMQSGVIVLTGEDSTMDIEGDFHLPSQKVVGGWATVHFKGRKYPITRRIRLERFNKGYAQWQVDAAGMIVKCAEADALRSSFPTMLGGLYMQDEVTLDVRSSKADTTSVETNRLVEVITDKQAGQATQQEQSAPAESDPEEAEAGLAPERQPRIGADAKQQDTPQVELASAVTSGGYTFSDLQKWGTESGNIPDADSLTGFRDIKTDVAARLLRAKNGLLKGLEAVKGGSR
jgi:phage recombination protein Bet